MKLETDGKKFHENLSKEIVGVYPWQYKDYNVVPVFLSPIEPDIKLYWDEQARFRKGFKIDNETKEVYIPNFFLKINGKYKKTATFSHIEIGGCLSLC